VYSGRLWSQDSLIPVHAPTIGNEETSGVVKRYIDLTLTQVAGSPDAFYNIALVDSIPFNFGDGSYNIVVKDGSGSILPPGYHDYEVDNAAGVLRFYTGAPASVPPSISFYKYVGNKGAVSDVISGDSILNVSKNNGVFTLTITQSEINHQSLGGVGTKTHSDIDAHLNDINANPHSTSLEQARSISNILSGSIDMSGNKIVNLLPGTSANEAVTVAQLEAFESGLTVRESVNYATTVTDILIVSASGSQLGKTLTASQNGLLSIDSSNPGISETILVKNQPDSIDNGIYVVTSTGSVDTPFVLTRDTRYDGTPDTEVKSGDYFFITKGVGNRNTGWSLSSAAGHYAFVNLGTSVQSFYTLSTGVTVAGGSGGNVYSLINNSWNLMAHIDDTSISTIGESWNGGILVGAVNGKVYTFNGSTWDAGVQVAPFMTYITCIIGVFGGRIIAGAVNGKVYTFDGTNWDTGFQLDTQSLYGITRNTNNGDILVGSNSGVVYTFNGSTWDAGVQVGVGSGDGFVCLHTMSDGNILFGFFDTMYIFDGTDWNGGEYVAYGILSISSQSTGKIFLGTSDGTVYMKTGSTWNSGETLDANQGYLRVHVLSNDDVLVSGDQGRVYSADGTFSSTPTAGWRLTTEPVVDSTDLVFYQFSGPGTFTAGNGLILEGNRFSIDPNQDTVINVENGITDLGIPNRHIYGLGGSLTRDTSISGGQFDAKILDLASLNLTSNTIDKSEESSIIFRPGELTSEEVTLEGYEAGIIATTHKDASLIQTSDGNDTKLVVRDGEVEVNSTKPNFRGLTEYADYSKNYGPLSLVNKKYTDKEIESIRVVPDRATIELDEQTKVIKVANYSPLIDTYVARKQTWIQQPISNTPLVLQNDFGSIDIAITIYDESTGSKVVCSESVTTSSITITSNINFTGTIVIIG
jgi:hypothetical protein